MNTDRFARFKPYSGKLVALQLRAPLFMLGYGGSAMIEGKEQHGLVAAVMTKRTAEGEEVREAVGFAQIMPAVLLEVTESVLLLKVMDPMTGALLKIDVPPEEIVYITSVERPPSKIVAPGS